MNRTRSRPRGPWVWFGLALAVLLALAAYGLSGNPPTRGAATEPQVQQTPPVPPPPVVESPKPLSKRLVEYHISVNLDAGAKQLHGAQTVTWKNPGQYPVGELYLHLYPNAFASKDSTFMRESGGKLRQDKMKENSFGGMDVTAVKTVEGRDLVGSLEFVQPDDGNAADRTLAKLALPQPVAPGDSVTLHMTFTVRLPEAFARMGYSGDYVMAGQWFPKLAVYEPVGRRGRLDEGWNLHQYHGNSEFYSDFGIYNVRINVPSDYTVAATGFPTKPAVSDAKTKTYHFYADDVHDFAWAASPRFVYVEEPFSAPQVPGVKIKLYLDPLHENLKERYMTAAKKALTRYSEWYGTYPYSTLSIVVPPAEANGTGGMEYPSLVTAWGASSERVGHELERVIVHEIGHQWFYGMIASNEFEEAWLDEGFTSYAEDALMASEYGIRTNLPLEASYITSPAPLRLFSWNFRSHEEYADNVYTRAKLILLGIERQIGKDQMSRVMKTYAQRWKFRHPSTRDFQKVLEEITRKKWDDYFNQYVYGGLMVDHAVESIDTKPLGDGSGYESVVLIRRHGGANGAVPIHIHFADNTTRKELWDGRDDHIQYRITHSAPVDWVAIDPAHTQVLENRHINNFMKAELDEKWRIRWNVGLTRLIEMLYGWLAL